MIRTVRGKQLDRQRSSSRLHDGDVRLVSKNSVRTRQQEVRRVTVSKRKTSQVALRYCVGKYRKFDHLLKHFLRPRRQEVSGVAMFPCSVGDISLVEYKKQIMDTQHFQWSVCEKSAKAETHSRGRPFTDRNRNEATAPLLAR